MSAPRTFRPGRPDGESPLRMLAQHAVVLLAFVIIVASLAGCARPVAQLRHIAASPADAPASTVEQSYRQAAGLAAPIWVTAQWNDGWITLTQRTCGTSASWRQQQALNGGVGLIYGRQYRIDCALAAGTPVSSGWLYPLVSPPCRSTSGAGAFGAPRPGYSHQGIDLAKPTGTTVRAAQAGTVIFAGWNGGAGQQVQLRHAGGWMTKYNHLSYINRLWVGQSVAQGQHIGSVGNTGRSFGSHLHVEMWLNGRVQDPTGILAPRC